MERLMDSVRQQTAAQLDTQKGRATDSINVIAGAVRGTTDHLRNEHHDVLAGYVETIANRLEQLSTSLRDKDMSDLLTDARRLARRQPALFIGASFLLGLAAARFLKSSREHDTGSPGDQQPQWRADSPRGASDYGPRDSISDVTPGRASAATGVGRL